MAGKLRKEPTFKVTSLKEVGGDYPIYFVKQLCPGSPDGYKIIFKSHIQNDALHFYHGMVEVNRPPVERDIIESDIIESDY